MGLARSAARARVCHRTALLIVHMCSFFKIFRACMQCREQRTSDASFTTRI